MADVAVHVVELPTTFISGISHFKIKNVILRLVFPLIVTGMIGGIAGAFLYPIRR